NSWSAGSARCMFVVSTRNSSSLPDGLEEAPGSRNDAFRLRTAAGQPRVHGGETIRLLVPGVLVLDKPPPVLAQPSTLLIGHFKQFEKALGNFVCLGIDHNGSLGVGQLG